MVTSAELAQLVAAILRSRGTPAEAVDATELIVTGPLPVDVRVTSCVIVVFTITLPNATLVVLMLSVGSTSETVALADLLASATLVAVTVMVCALVIEAGAV